MKKAVCSLEQYFTLMDACMENIPDLIYNHMLLPKEVRGFIENGKFYYEQYDGDGIIFLTDERDFYKLYCFVSESGSIEPTKLDKPQVIECIYSVQRCDEQIEKMKQKILDMGFNLYVKNMRVRTNLDEISECDAYMGKMKNDLTWCYAEKKDLPEIYNLWSLLDRYNSILPKEEEAFGMIQAGELICLKKNGIICAIARMKEENRKMASTWMLVVSQEFRHQGIATELYKLLLSIAKAKGYSKVMHWCDEKNTAIQNTTEKLGFQFDGLKSNSYILK